MHRSIPALLICCSIVPGTLSADGDIGECAAPAAVTELETETASAGTLANLSNRDGSIRSASNRMLPRAIEVARSSQPAKRIVFESIPEPARKTSSDDAMCRQQEAMTTKAPIVFDDKRFASAEELTDWIMQFTRGKGADGESLYEQCPGKCSPQYTWWIDPDGDVLEVEARVVCGMPRDKSGNKYQLSTALTTPCPTSN